MSQTAIPNNVVAQYGYYKVCSKYGPKNLIVFWVKWFLVKMNSLL